MEVWGLVRRCNGLGLTSPAIRRHGDNTLEDRSYTVYASLPVDAILHVQQGNMSFTCVLFTFDSFRLVISSLIKTNFAAIHSVLLRFVTGSLRH